MGAGQWVSLLIRGCVKIGSHAGGIVVSGLVVWLDWGALCEDWLARWRFGWLGLAGLVVPGCRCVRMDSHNGGVSGGGVVVWLGGPWLCEDWLAFWRSA